jgi:hypothetical protein
VAILLLEKHLTPDHDIEGLNSARGWHQKKRAEKAGFVNCMASGVSTVS